MGWDLGRERLIAMELYMDSRIARDEIDWFLRAGSGDLKIDCFGTADFIKRAREKVSQR